MRCRTKEKEPPETAPESGSAPSLSSRSTPRLFGVALYDGQKDQFIRVPPKFAALELSIQQLAANGAELRMLDIIEFTRAIDGAYDIFSIRPDGMDLRRLTTTPGNDAHGAWSPDGKHIV